MLYEMGSCVTQSYDENAQILKALSHPTRLRLLELIREKQPCVKHMEETLGVAQPNISQHLSLLRNMGIVSSNREGNKVCYEINNSLVINILDALKK